MPEANDDWTEAQTEALAWLERACFRMVSAVVPLPGVWARFSPPCPSVLGLLDPDFVWG